MTIAPANLSDEQLDEEIRRLEGVQSPGSPSAPAPVSDVRSMSDADLNAEIRQLEGAAAESSPADIVNLEGPALADLVRLSPPPVEHEFDRGPGVPIAEAITSLAQNVPTVGGPSVDFRTRVEALGPAGLDQIISSPATQDPQFEILRRHAKSIDDERTGRFEGRTPFGTPTQFGEMDPDIKRDIYGSILPRHTTDVERDFIVGKQEKLLERIVDKRLPDTAAKKKFIKDNPEMPTAEKHAIWRSMGEIDNDEFTSRFAKGGVRRIPVIGALVEMYDIGVIKATAEALEQNSEVFERASRRIRLHADTEKAREVGDGRPNIVSDEELKLAKLRVKNYGPVIDKQAEMLMAFKESNDELSIRGTTLKAGAIEAIKNSATFMGEFALAGGFRKFGKAVWARISGKAGGRALLGTASRSVLKREAIRAAKTKAEAAGLKLTRGAIRKEATRRTFGRLGAAALSGAGKTVSPAMLPRVGLEVERNLMPRQWHIENNRFVVDEKGMDHFGAFVNAFTKVAVENITEHLGPELAAGFFAVAGKVPVAGRVLGAFNRFLAKKYAKAGTLGAAFKAVGFDGFLEEWLEESAGGFAGAILDTEATGQPIDQRLVDFLKTETNLRQMITRALVIAVPTGASIGVGQAQATFSLRNKERMLGVLQESLDSEEFADIPAEITEEAPVEAPVTPTEGVPEPQITEEAPKPTPEAPKAVPVEKGAPAAAETPEAKAEKLKARPAEQKAKDEAAKEPEPTKAPTVPSEPAKEAPEVITPEKGTEIAPEGEKGLGAAKTVLEAAEPYKEWLGDDKAEGDGFEQQNRYNEAVESEVAKIAKAAGWQVSGKSGSLGSYYIDVELIADSDISNESGDWEEGDVLDTFQVRVSNHKQAYSGPVWSFGPGDNAKMVKLGLAEIQRLLKEKGDKAKKPATAPEKKPALLSDESAAKKRTVGEMLKAKAKEKVESEWPNQTIGEYMEGASTRVFATIDDGGKHFVLSLVADKGAGKGMFKVAIRVDGKSQGYVERFTPTATKLAKLVESMRSVFREGVRIQPQVKVAAKSLKKTPIQNMRSNLRKLRAKKFKTRGDEIKIARLQKLIKHNPNKWEAGQGVGWRPVKGQTNRGYRIVETKPDAYEVTIEAIVDTGDLADYKQGERTTVSMIDLIRDKQYDTKPTKKSRTVGEVTRKKKPEPGTTEEVSVDSLEVDAARFQYKIGLGEKGVGPLLLGVKKFDKAKAGVVGVWTDPADGKTYVINGHQRYGLAKRTGTKTINVIYLEAENAGEARVVGALINIAEGRGNAVDAAKVFRESGFTAKELEDSGISIKEPMARQGMALSKLAPGLFDAVVREEISVGRGEAIANAFIEHGDQLALFKDIQRQEQIGQSVTIGDINEIATMAQSAGTETVSQQTLFGEDRESKNLVFTKARLLRWLKSRLRSDKKLFGMAARKAGELARADNIIDVAKSQGIAEQAALSEFYIDQLTQQKGPAADALDKAARAITNGENQSKVRKQFEAEVLSAISEALGVGKAEGAVEREAVSGGEPDVEAVPTTDIFGKKIEKPKGAAGKQGGLGIGKGELTEVAVGEVKIKPTLKQAIIRALQTTKHGKLWRAGEGLSKNTADALLAEWRLRPKETNGYFNDPSNPKPEFNEAVIQVTKGGALFAEAEKPGILSASGKKALEDIKAITKKMRDKKGGFFSDEVGSLDPRLLKSMAILGIDVARGLAVAAKNKVVTFAEWSAKIIDMAGEDVVPYLQDTWEHIREGQATEAETLASINAPFTGPVQSAKEVKSGGEVTSIKNAVMDVMMEELGHGPAVRGPGVTQKELVEEAGRRFAENPFIGEKLVGSFASNPRIPTGLDNVMLGYEATRLKLVQKKAEMDYQDAVEAGNEGAAEEAKSEEQKADVARVVLANLTATSGTDSSHSLYFRRLLFRDDFTLETMTRKAVVKNGGKKLNAKQTAEIEGEHETIKRTQKGMDRREIEIEREQTAKALSDTHEQIVAEVKVQERQQKKKARKAKGVTVRSGEKNKLVTIEMKDAALERFKEKMASAKFAAVPPFPLADAVIIGAFHIERGVRTFTEWSKTVLADLGETAKPHLDDLWEKSNAHVTKEGKERILDTIADGESQGIAPVDMHNSFRVLARIAIEEGHRSRDQMVDAVMADVKDIFPDATKREVSAAISEGARRELSKNEIDVLLRDYTGQLRQVAKIQKLLDGIPLDEKIPGDTKSQERRRLDAQLRELLIITDPAAQKRAVLNAIETRLRNEIADIDRQIASGNRTVKVRRFGLTSDIVEDLKELRDAKKEQFNEVFGVEAHKLSDERRLAIAEKAAEKNLAETERRVREKDLFPVRQPAKASTSARLTSLRAKNNAARQELRELQLLAKPNRTPAEVALQARKTRLRNQTARLRERLANRDFVKHSKEARTRLEDPESRALAIENTEAKRAYHGSLFKFNRAQRSKGRKAFDFSGEIIGVPRSVITSFDLPPLLRQGLLVTLSRPGLSTKAFAKALTAVSKGNRTAIDAAIRLNPHYAEYIAAGLPITERGVELSHMEEEHRSRLAEYIPGVAMSERVFSTYLNLLRMSSMDAMREAFGGTLTKPQAKIFANYIAIATGRGNTGLRRADAVLSASAAGIFAPRRWLGLIQYMTLNPIWTFKASYKGTLAARAFIATEYLRAYAGWTVLVALGVLAGGVMEDDELATGFGKMRFGKTRIDTTAGMAGIYTFLMRMIKGQTTTSFGERRDLRGDSVPYRGTTSMDILVRHLKSKLAPVPGEVVAWATQEDFKGDRPELGRTLKNLGIPIPITETIDIFKQEDGGMKRAILTLVGLVGGSLSTYRNFTNEAIEALRAGDEVKAQKIANESNKQKADYKPFMTIKRLKKTLLLRNRTTRTQTLSHAAHAWLENPDVIIDEVKAYNKTVPPVGKKKFGRNRITESQINFKAKTIKAKREGRKPPRKPRPLNTF